MMPCVGAGTVRADDPTLTVRGLGIDRQPVRVVVSRGMKIPADCQLARTARDVPVWLCHGATSDASGWTDQGAMSLPCTVSAGQVDPHAAMTALSNQGITRVFCEGGGMLAASLLSAGLVDRLVVFTAGMAMGAEGTPSLAAMGIDRLSHAPRFALEQVQSLGGDIMHHWRRV